MILFASCSCRRVYWWSSRRPRVLESSGLSPVFFPFRGPTPISRMFLCLRPSRSRSSIPSLAPSWWSPCPLWQRALLPLSCYVLSVPSAFSLHRPRLSIPFALSPLSRCVLADDIRPLRIVALASAPSPHALGSIGALGIRGGSTYIALHQTWSVSTVLTYAPWGSGRCLRLLPARLSASFRGDCLFSFTDLYMSLPKKSRGVVLFGHMT